MKITFFFFSIFLFCSCLSPARKTHIIQRDKIKFKSGNTETGKVIKFDSSRVVLQKFDFSERNFYWKTIDTIMGLSYNTGFISAALGISQVNYFSTFYYANTKYTGIGLHVRMGKMIRNHWAYFLEINELPRRKFNVFKTGIGFNYYFMNGYLPRACGYAGASFEMNKVAYNSSVFFNPVYRIGGEYRGKTGPHFFSEFMLQKNFSDRNKKTGFTFNIGVRFNREYVDYYKKINSFKP